MMDFTVIAASRHRFGDNITDEKPSIGEIERGLETDAPFVGAERTFQFQCPNVDRSQFGILLFQAQGVSQRDHTFELNGHPIYGGIPRSVESAGRSTGAVSGETRHTLNAFWNGTVALINPGMLQESNSLLVRVTVYTYSGAITDDFVLDNMVMLFKTRGSAVSGPIRDVFEPR